MSMELVREKFRIIARNRKTVISFAFVLFFLLMALIGPALFPMDRSADFLNRFQPPSFRHILGTDYAGRDILIQIIHGSRDVMMIAFSTGFFGVTIALLLGILAGLAGGWIDVVIMRTIDVFLTVPAFPIMAIMAALFRINSPLMFGLVLALWSWPTLARAIRTQVMVLSRKEFVEAARIMNMSLPHIMIHEILPNIMPFITINFINISRGAITASVGIMMLGLVPMRVENWGMMLNMAAFQTGALFIPRAYSYLLSPMLAIIIFQYSLVIFASGLDEIFDPRLRTR